MFSYKNDFTQNYILESHKRYIREGFIYKQLCELSALSNMKNNA